MKAHNDFDYLNDQVGSFILHGPWQNTADFKESNSLQVFYSSLSKKYFEGIICFSKKMIRHYSKQHIYLQAEIFTG